MLINRENDVPILVDEMSIIRKKMVGVSAKERKKAFLALEQGIRKHIGKLGKDEVLLAHVSTCVDGYETLKPKQTLTIRVAYDPNDLEELDVRMFVNLGKVKWEFGRVCRP